MQSPDFSGPPPRVSVILPAYNADATIEESIKSILEQDFGDFELLVFDDGSTDLTYEKVVAIPDPRIRVFRRENKGLPATLNELLALARGGLVARMDADDVAYASRLRKQVEAFDRCPDLVLLGGQIDFLVGDRIYPGTFLPADHDLILSNLLVRRFSLCHPAVMFRRAAAVAAGGYQISGPGEDLDFFLRLSEIGRLGNIPDKVLQYRMTLGSLSASRHAEVSRAYAFSLENYRRRRLSMPEIPAEEFFSFSENDWVSKIKEWAARRSEEFYRRHFLARSRGRRLTAIGFLLGSALLRPRRVLQRILTRILSSRNR